MTLTPIVEMEVYITKDGLGRAAICQRPDGLFHIYSHWMWPEDHRTSWVGDQTPVDVLYGQNSEVAHQPDGGVYGQMDDARREVRALRGFSDANLLYSCRCVPE